jgi:hypothetical protein
LFVSSINLSNPALSWMSGYATYISGGAGMLLTAPAARQLVARLYPSSPVAAAVFNPQTTGATATASNKNNPGCGPPPAKRLNDVVLSACAWEAGLPLLHLQHLQPEFDSGMMDAYRVRSSLAEVGSLATVHRVFPAYMHDWLHRDLRRVKYPEEQLSMRARSETAATTTAAADPPAILTAGSIEDEGDFDVLPFAWGPNPIPV